MDFYYYFFNVIYYVMGQEQGKQFHYYACVRLFHKEKDDPDLGVNGFLKSVMHMEKVSIAKSNNLDPNTLVSKRTEITDKINPKFKELIIKKTEGQKNSSYIFKKEEIDKEIKEKTSNK